MDRVTLRDVKLANDGWFSKANMRFFGDKRYWVYVGKISKRHYLVRLTEAWIDMFDKDPRLHYRINELNKDLKIGKMVEPEFKTLEDAKFWLKYN